MTVKVFTTYTHPDQYLDNEDKGVTYSYTVSDQGVLTIVETNANIGGLIQLKEEHEVVCVYSPTAWLRVQ